MLLFQKQYTFLHASNFRLVETYKSIREKPSLWVRVSKLTNFTIEWANFYIGRSFRTYKFRHALHQSNKFNKKLGGLNKCNQQLPEDMVIALSYLSIVSYFLHVRCAKPTAVDDRNICISHHNLGASFSLEPGWIAPQPMHSTPYLETASKLDQLFQTA